MMATAKDELEAHEKELDAFRGELHDFGDKFGEFKGIVLWGLLELMMSTI